MAVNEEQRTIYMRLLLVAVLGSLIQMIGAIYIIKTYSLLFGVGLGAYVQGAADNANVVPIAAQYTSSLGTLHAATLEAYVLFIIALLSFAIAALAFLRNYDGHGQNTARKYTAPYLAIALIYVLLFYITTSLFYGDLNAKFYMYVLYFGIALSFFAGIFLEYLNRQDFHAKGPARMKNAIEMDPSKPFSNVADLQNELFSKMSGHLRIVDKHFNSAALSNFHRLIDKNMSNFTKITILSSREMLDSDFGSNVTDFRNELNEAGVGIEIRLMDDKDATEQHERLLLDDRIAYKVPPFNIINKRSEHITKIGFGDAQKRFTQLYSRAIKLENYAIKKARGAEQQKETPPDTGNKEPPQ